MEAPARDRTLQFEPWGATPSPRTSFLRLPKPAANRLIPATWTGELPYDWLPHSMPSASEKQPRNMGLLTLSLVLS